MVWHEFALSAGAVHRGAMMLARAAAGAVAAALIAIVARRAGSLSDSGAVAALVVGSAATAAGWRWGALLVVYFVAAVLLSRLRAAAREARIGAIVAKGGRRDAIQVLANGGVFALLALGTLASAHGALSAAALGALAAATADTWSTELGTLSSTPPRSLLSLQPVPAGTSGGVSVIGCLALIAGAMFIALVARLLGLDTPMGPVIAGGITGALADSLLGATMQERRWCAACARATERTVHDCGAPTTRAGGMTWLDNDGVNFAATIAGAATAALLAS